MSTPAYLVASRQGLYFVSRHGWREGPRGLFFGIVCVEDQVFAFRHGLPGQGGAAHSGRVVRFRWRSGALYEVDVLVEGLDYNCHQLGFFDNSFFVVDTLHQRILEYDAAWRPVAAHQILPPAPRDGAGHGHLNSIAGTSDSIWVMLHNQPRGLPSEIVEMDRGFCERRRTVLPCHGCHDILPLDDGRLLTCLSPRGQIAAEPGPAYPIDECWTRGLALGPDEIVVGSSLYGKRFGRALLPGFITFLDRSYRQTARFYLPAGPTQIQRVGFDPFGTA
ncbi:MAG TPA: hypothetical protein VGA98_03395 [Allosphingosinicella sp.]|jgi:hypothetical protein